MEPQLLVYMIFFTVLILYDVTQLDVEGLFKNSAFLVMGTTLIALLCASEYNVAAWILLVLIILLSRVNIVDSNTSSLPGDCMYNVNTEGSCSSY